MNEGAFRGLLSRADVLPEKELAAREWLAFYLSENAVSGTKTRKSRARSLFDAAGQRGAPAEHNAPLEKVRKAAEALGAAIIALRRRPYAHSDFWMLSGFSGAQGDELEACESLRMLKVIQDAAARAKFKRGGRPPEISDRRIVDLALLFYKEFAPRQPTATISKSDRGFMAFTAAFYEAATGKKREAEELLGHVRTALKVMKETAQRKM